MKLKKNFNSSKEIDNQVKRQTTEWEESLATYTSGRRLVSSIYKEILKFKHQQNKQRD